MNDEYQLAIRFILYDFCCGLVPERQNKRRYFWFLRDLCVNLLGLKMMMLRPQNTPDRPLVSFIITTFNTEPTMLRCCINSIRSLSFGGERREIIVIDDGSDRPAINELLDISDDIIYLRQRNQGISVARNRGTDMASGRYIQFVDSDDSLLRPAYEHCLDVARRLQPDVVGFAFTHRQCASVQKDVNGPFDGADYMLRHSIKGAAWGYLFKKELLNGLRFRPDFDRYAEDEEFTALLVLRAKRLFTTSAKAYFYRQHPHSVIHHLGKRNLVKRQVNTERAVRHLQERLASLPNPGRLALQRRIAQLSMDYLYNTARLTHSLMRLNKACERLRTHGLFPLPEQEYTRKYALFRRLCNTKWGRGIIIAATFR